MKVSKGAVLILAFMMLFVSCNMNSRREVVTQTVNGTVFEVKKWNNNKLANDSALEANGKHNTGMVYLVMNIYPVAGNKSILQDGIASQGEYYKRLDYFNYKMKQDLSLNIGEETYPAVVYSFERSYELSKYSRVLVGFDVSGSKDERDMTLSYDGTFMNTGIVKFYFK